MFLQGSGGALLAIPFLESLLPSTAWGQAASTPKRFLALIDRQDIGHNSNWIPNLSGNPYNIPQPANSTTINGEKFFYQQLSDFTQGGRELAPMYGTALNPYLNSINIMRSLDHSCRRAHDTSRVLGGLGFWDDYYGDLQRIPTIDQVINEKVGDGRPVIFGGDTGADFMSLARAPGSSMRATWLGVSLQELYNSIFRNGTFPDSSTVSSSTSRRDVLSRVLGDFTRVMNSRNISALDKVVLSNALDKMSDVQRGLAALPSAQCSYKSLNVGTYGTWQMSPIPQAGKALADLLTVSMMCDAARVFTIGTEVFQDVLQGEVYDHQTTSHTPWAPVAAAGGKFEWQIMGLRHKPIFTNFIAPLLQNLSTTIDPSNGQSLLYNSLVYISRESGQVHGWGSQPVITAGNAGGAITSGNYIDFADRTKGGPFEGCDTNNATDNTRLFDTTPGSQYFSNNWRGLLYNRVLVTCLQAMGLTPVDYENRTLNAQLYNQTTLGAQNTNLTSIGGYGYAYDFDVKKSISATRPIEQVVTDIKFYDLNTFGRKLPLP